MGKTPPDYLGAGETLVMTTEIGMNFILNPDGHFEENFSGVVGKLYYLRAFNAPSIASATYYGNSAGYTVISASSQQWIVTSFKTDQTFDLIPPGPPVSLEANPESIGDIYLAWHNTTEADLANVEVRARTDGIYPTRETEGVRVFFGAASPGTMQYYTHNTVVEGVTYYYSAFSVDSSGNYSTGCATDFATAHDTVSPEVIAWGPTGSGVNINANAQLIFSEPMNKPSVVSAFSIYPSAPSSVFSWSTSGAAATVELGTLSYSTTYVVSVDTTATDLAGNRLDPIPFSFPNPFTFSFTTQAPPPDLIPPLISNFRVDSRRIVEGDVISTKPRITAVISDEGDPSRIASVEFSANSIVRYAGTPGSGFNTITGTFEYDVPGSSPLTKGDNTIRLRAWDLSGNMTEEVHNLRAFNEIAVLGRILNYPNPFSPQKHGGTYIAYTLKSDFDVTLYIYDISAHLLWKRTFRSGLEGGHVGYNEVFWNGKTAFGEYAPNGIVILKLAGEGKVLGTCKLTVID